jgi:hypothetical protein
VCTKRQACTPPPKPTIKLPAIVEHVGGPMVSSVPPSLPPANPPLSEALLTEQYKSVMSAWLADQAAALAEKKAQADALRAKNATAQAATLAEAKAQADALRAGTATAQAADVGLREGRVRRGV